MNKLLLPLFNLKADNPLYKKGFTFALRHILINYFRKNFDEKMKI